MGLSVETSAGGPIFLVVAEFTLDRPDVFPTETKVGVYAAGAVPDLQAAPEGAALQTKQVGFVEEKEGKPVFNAVTAITFTGLSTANYLAGAKINGIWRYVRFAAGTLGASLKPPARYPTHGV